MNGEPKPLLLMAAWRNGNVRVQQTLGGHVTLTGTMPERVRLPPPPPSNR